MKRAISYARVSTEEQKDNYSLETQQRANREHIVKQGYRLIGEYAEDASGAALHRVEMNKILEQAARKEFDVLVCHDLDRFARDPSVQFILEHDFKKHSVSIEYVLHEFESTPEGNLQKMIYISFAQFERAKIAERFTRGKLGKARSGKIPGKGGGLSRYGYRYVNGCFEVDDGQAQIVRLIYHWYTAPDAATGKPLGITQIAARLTEMKVPTNWDNKPNSFKTRPFGYWSTSAVDLILKDTTYIGNYYYNKTRAVKKGRSVPRPKEEWIKIDVPAIIDEETFQRALNQRLINTTYARRNTKNFYLMRQRLQCSSCGGSMHASARGKHYYYTCTGQKAIMDDHYQRICHGYVRADRVDEAVWKAIKNFLEDSDNIRQALTSKGDEDDLMTSRVEELTREIRNMEKQRTKLLDLYLDSSLPRDLLDQRNLQIQERIEQFTTTLEQLKAQHIAKLTPEDVDEIVAMIDIVRHQIDNATDEQKQFVMRMLDIRAVLNRETKTIHLEGLLPTQDVHINWFSQVNMSENQLTLFNLEIRWAS
jgi:site-specific DNA recombinase